MTDAEKILTLCIVGGALSLYAINRVCLSEGQYRGTLLLPNILTGSVAERGVPQARYTMPGAIIGLAFGLYTLDALGYHITTEEIGRACKVGCMISEILAFGSESSGFASRHLARPTHGEPGYQGYGH